MLVGGFYKPSSYRGFIKFFKKYGFRVRQDGPHMIAIHPGNDEVLFSVPHSSTISNGVTKELCDKLVALGYSEEEVKKYILR